MNRDQKKQAAAPPAKDPKVKLKLKLKGSKTQVGSIMSKMLDRDQDGM